MPEYLAPGVFVEETSFRAKIIEGVSTTTTAFVGPTRYGPIDLESELVTGLGEFELAFGGRTQLEFSDEGERHNYVWHAARAFFEEGGKRLYVSRVFRRKDDTAYGGPDETPVADGDGEWPDGHGRASLPAAASAALQVRARYPGAAGNMRVRFTVRTSQNILSFDGQLKPRLGAVSDRDVVLVTVRHGPTPGSPPYPSASGGPLHVAHREDADWRFEGDGGAVLRLSQLQFSDDYDVRVVTVDVSVLPTDGPGQVMTWPALALDPAHVRDGAPDSLLARFRFDATDPSRGRDIPIVVEAPGLETALAVLQALLDAGVRSAPPDLADALEDDRSSDAARSVDVTLSGGNDGARPGADEYKGAESVATGRKTGLEALKDLEDVSIVAAPGATYGYNSDSYGSEARGIVGHLIAHCEEMRYRIAILDSGNGQSLAQVRSMRAKLDSKHAALYYPWVKVLDPVTREIIPLPPSGFVAGIYARNDRERAVYKAPANEVVRLAQGFEVLLNRSQQEVLNPEGINAFRYFEGRGYRLWGARTVSSDPEWKYVNVRRYFAYLERSIDKGTQWAVFEPNGEALWANVRRTIEDFLLNEWQMGALLGDKPEKAYFVRCDRSTMTQNDLDNGRLVCLIGVAALRPAEFVIFRIGQWTADARRV